MNLKRKVIAYRNVKEVFQLFCTELKNNLTFNENTEMSAMRSQIQMVDGLDIKVITTSDINAIKIHMQDAIENWLKQNKKEKENDVR